MATNALADWLASQQDYSAILSQFPKDSEGNYTYMMDNGEGQLVPSTMLGESELNQIQQAQRQQAAQDQIRALMASGFQLPEGWKVAGGNEMIDQAGTGWTVGQPGQYTSIGYPNVQRLASGHEIIPTAWLAQDTQANANSMSNLFETLGPALVAAGAGGLAAANAAGTLGAGSISGGAGSETLAGGMAGDTIGAVPQAATTGPYGGYPMPAPTPVATNVIQASPSFLGNALSGAGSALTKAAVGAGTSAAVGGILNAGGVTDPLARQIGGSAIGGVVQPALGGAINTGKNYLSNNIGTGTSPVGDNQASGTFGDTNMSGFQIDPFGGGAGFNPFPVTGSYDPGSLGDYSNLFPNTGGGDNTMWQGGSPIDPTTGQPWSGDGTNTWPVGPGDLGGNRDNYDRETMGNPDAYGLSRETPTYTYSPELGYQPNNNYSPNQTYNPSNTNTINIQNTTDTSWIDKLLGGFNTSKVAEAGILAAASKYAADQQRAALEGVAGQQTGLAREFMGLGAPARARLEAAYDPNFSMFNVPGYADAVNRTADIASRKWSTQDNPYGNPALQAGIYRDVLSERTVPDYFTYLGLQGSQGGLGGAMGGASTLFNQAGNASMAAAQQSPWPGYASAIRTAFDKPVDWGSLPQITIGGMPVG